MNIFRFTHLAPFLVTLSAITASHAIELHRDLPVEQRQSFEYDLAYLDRISLTDDTWTQAALVKLELSGPPTSESMRRWLEERVKFIVPESWDFNTLITPNGPQTYPNANNPPLIESKNFSKWDQASTAMDPQAPNPRMLTLMHNRGSVAYIRGKSKKIAQLAKIDELNIVPVNSPRVGIIQVGEGFFLERFRIQTKRGDVPANSIARLATLFHEARHNDGNGSSLGFVHAFCPVGHPYAGQGSCDRNRNGPYSIAAAALKVMLRNCRECSAYEKENLRIRIADYANRVIVQTNSPPTSVGLTRLNIQVRACELNRKIGFKETSDCREARENLRAAKFGKITLSTDWDATPEMISE